MKKGLIVLGVGVLSIMTYLSLRKRQYRFYDNVWCKDQNCSDFNSQEKVDRYMRGAEPRSSARFDSGQLTLVFEKPHKLKRNSTILIEQDAGATFPLYDGLTTITKVPNDFTIVVNKPRRGNTATNGGTVTTESVLSNIFN